ncbi:MAG: hypothetical protein WDN31_16555 [Hyphomicrobium sp.]
MFASVAEAGFKIRLGFGGPLPAFTAHGGGYHSERQYHRKRYIARHSVKKEKVQVAKRKAKPEPKVAKVEKDDKVIATAPVVEPEVIADSENSSISTASLEPQTTEPAVIGSEGAKATSVQPAAASSTIVKPEPKPTKAASKLDCKKFFPSVGMTLTVPCE